jgi:D-glycerate 3-kinase
LQDSYLDLFELVDTWIMLKAPSFYYVFNCHLEQENKLRESTSRFSNLMNDHDIKKFIQHYQRITENTLDVLPAKVDYLFELDEQREIIKLSGLGDL